MESKKVTINEKDYDLVYDFKNDAEIRHSFNALARSTFDFDFEDYYVSGYWNERYTPYALLDGGRVVANAAANILDFCVLGKMKRYIQIGTVMTEKAHRNRGLARFLLETIIEEWQEKSDMIYLFANDTVLDFYPKYGFCKKMEYQYTKVIAGNEHNGEARHLDMEDAESRALLFHRSDNTLCFSKLSALHNTGLVMFYATSFKKECFYDISELEATVFAEYRDNILYLNDVFCSHAVAVDEIILAMAKPDTTRVVLGFTPVDTTGYRCETYFEDDNTLFVLSKDKSICNENRLMFPILSHS